MKLITMCSTRSRPDMFMRMAKSFVDTKEGADSFLVAYVYNKDPKVDEYKALDLSGMDCVSIHYGKDRCMVEVLNHLALESFPGADFYSEVNDDHVFVTPGWDVKMMLAISRKNGGIAIAYGKTDNMPTATMHSGVLVRAMGYFFPPQYRHSWVDNWLTDIGFGTNILTHLPDVLIDHRHPAFGKSEKDATYGFAERDYPYGKEVFDTWAVKQKAVDYEMVEKLKVDARLALTGDLAVACAVQNQSAAAAGSYRGNSGCVLSSQDLLKKYNLPAGFGPQHPDWGTPSKMFRYRAMLDEAGL